MSKIKERTKIRYGRLVVIEFAGTDWHNHALWKCKCNCGKEIIVEGNSLQSGNTKSCGCYKQELDIKKAKEMGLKNKGNIPSNYIDGRQSKIAHELKEERRKKDNWICQECNKTQEDCRNDYRDKLDVHHIDGNDMNNNLENMITLCHNCHQKLHHKQRRE